MVNKEIMKRRLTQWVVLPVFLVTIFFGWKYPLLGFSVPVVMLVGFVGSFFRGRYVCGHLCPRGSFYDRVFVFFEGGREVPALFKNMNFRWTVFVVLMLLMGYRISLNPTSLEHIGLVFWQMCFFTTLLGMLLALRYKSRTWCSFCPMGTVQNAIGGYKAQIRIDQDKCIRCRACERICPMGVKVLKYLHQGVITDRDCVKCRECVYICPKYALK